MFPREPLPTAILLAIFGALLGLSALLSRALARIGVPVVVLFMLLGMAAGRGGVELIAFDDYNLAFRIGLVGLALILFDGGLSTPVGILRRNLAPSVVLATVGVILTTGLVAVAGRLLGFSWLEALLLGAVVSSTDAAAVFAVLRGSGLQLKQRVGATLELESGLNDPMAAILTVLLTRALVEGGGATSAWHITLEIVGQLVLGAGLGAGIGYVARGLLRVQPLAGGLFPVMTISAACVAFGVPTLVGGSGLLAVYVAGVVLGNGPLPYRAGLLRVHDFLGWLAQVIMFVVLGLLVSPSELLAVAGLGLAVAAFLAVVARPVAVFLCLAPFGYTFRQKGYIGWVGLRGAVPIILAAFPVLAGIPGARVIFDVVFFVVVVSAVIQGGSVRWLTGRLGMQSKRPPPPPALLEITSTTLLGGESMVFYIDRASAVCGASLADIPFPAGAAAMLVVRGREPVAPKGDTVLTAGDHVYVFSKPDDVPTIRLLFGRREDDE